MPPKTTAGHYPGSICHVCSQIPTAKWLEGTKTADGTEFFLYGELNPHEEFRTVNVLKGIGDDDIQCTLQRRCMRHPPQYEALSYEWGPSTSESSTSPSVSLNGVRVTVTDNLWSALHYLRLPERDRLLWVDAICIWQSNVEERTEQVAKMAFIYGSAVRVVSWVGLSMQDVVQSSMVFLVELITTRAENRGASAELKSKREKARADIKRLSTTKMVPYSKILSILRDIPEVPLSEKTIIASQHDKKEWQDISGFLSVRYWKRLWIVQEVVLARELCIQCGDCFIDGSLLFKLLTYLRYASEKDVRQYICQLGSTPAAKVLYYKLDMGSEGWRRGLGLVESLVSFMTSRCGDPRDKVYGLIGIADDAEDVQPDYRRTPLELYETLVSTPRFRTDDALVSFSQLVQKLMGGLFHSRNPMLTSAGGPTAIGDHYQQPGTFYTRGVVCGNITVVGEPFTTTDKARKLLTKWHELYFHRIRDHGPGEELPSTVRDALPYIAKDARRAMALITRMSYCYPGVEGSATPSWKDMRDREGEWRHPQTSTKDSTDNAGDESTETIGEDQESPKASLSSLLGDICKRLGNENGVCECMRTIRVPLPPIWVIGSRGQIVLAPATAKEGDVICHFENSDVAVVVRPHLGAWTHSIVGGAIILRQWDEEPAKMHKRSPEVFRYSVGTKRRDFAPFREQIDQMSFHLDRTCLRLLTSQPSDLEAFSDDPLSGLKVLVKEHFEWFTHEGPGTTAEAGVGGRPQMSYRATTESGILPDRPHLRSGKPHWGVPPSQSQW